MKLKQINLNHENCFQSAGISSQYPMIPSLTNARALLKDFLSKLSIAAPKLPNCLSLEHLGRGRGRGGGGS